MIIKVHMGNLCLKLMKKDIKIGIIGLDTSYVEIIASLAAAFVANLNSSLAR